MSHECPTSALHWKLQNRGVELRLEDIQDFLRNGARINDLPYPFHHSALHVAARYSNAIVVRELLLCGGNVNSIDYHQEDTPLHKAITRSDPQLDVVQELLRHGANVNARNKNGMFPLQLSMYCADLIIVEELLQYGADVSVTDPYLDTPLHTVVKTKPTKIEYIKTLLKFGADTEARDNFGRTPLHIACENGLVEAVLVLLAYGANVDSRTNFGETPLYVTVFSPRQSYEIVKQLVAHGADVNAKERSGGTPLVSACFWERLDVVELLLRHGAVVTEQCVFRFGASCQFLTLGVKFDHKKLLDYYLHVPNVHVIKLIIRYNFIQKCHCLNIAYEELFSHDISVLLRKLSNNEIDFEEYRDECAREVKSLSHHLLHCKLSIWDCIVRGVEWCHSEIIQSRIIQVINSSEYPIYNSILINKLNKQIFIDIAINQKIYSYDEDLDKKVVLNSYCVKKLGSYLTAEELFHLVQAFNTTLTNNKKRKVNFFIPKEKRKLYFLRTRSKAEPYFLRIRQKKEPYLLKTGQKRKYFLRSAHKKKNIF